MSEPIEVQTVCVDELRETWALRGHPVLLRRRWAQQGMDVDSDESVRTFCADADLDEAVTLLVDLASMSQEPALNRRADIAAARIVALDPWP